MEGPGRRHDVEQAAWSDQVCGLEGRNLELGTARFQCNSDHRGYCNRLGTSESQGIRRLTSKVVMITLELASQTQEETAKEFAAALDRQL